MYRRPGASFYLLAAVATVRAAQSYFSWPGGWSILVPALLPPLLALYGISARPAFAGGGRLYDFLEERTHDGRKSPPA